MIVNWHAHARPPEQNEAERARTGRALQEIGHLLEIHEQHHIDLAVVTDPLLYLRGKSDDQALRLIQRWNEYAAEQQQRYPDRTIFFAGSVAAGGDAFLKELERAIKDYKLRGVYINSSHNGRYPDEDEARGFFELVTSLDIPVFFHAHSGIGEEHMQMYRLVSSLGRPFDECLSLARLIVRGIFKQFPTLKLVASHLGGGICEFIGRMDYAYELQEQASFLGPYAPMLIDMKPSEYLRQHIWLDTAAYHAPAIKCGIESVGIEHMVHGADVPSLDPLLRRSVELIEELPLGKRDKEAILFRNALGLIGLSERAPADGVIV